MPAGGFVMTVRPNRPLPAPTLSRGSSVRIRPTKASDAALVLDAFTRMSNRSRRLRFLSAKPRLTDAELRYFTDVDHHDHEAVVAVSRFDGRIVGGARFVRLAHDPDSADSADCADIADIADIAVTVVHDWQGQGLGGHLIARLIERAREEGVVRLVALVADDNVVVAGMLQKFGAAVRVVERGHGASEYQIALDGSGAAATRTWLAVG
jgi:GNAT superfamily N-acetyltransferase